MYVCMYVYSVCMGMYMSVRACVCVFIYIYTRMYVCMWMYPWVYACVACVYGFMCEYIMGVC